MTTHQSKPIKIGNSLYILIPLQTKRLLNITEESLLKVTIEKVAQREVKTYQCLACEHVFGTDEDSSDDELECPICNNSNLAIKEEEAITGYGDRLQDWRM